MERDVVVTGIGLLTALGETADNTWAGLLDERSGAGPITRFDPDKANVRANVACEIGTDPAADTSDDRIDDRTMGRYTQFAVAAAVEALEDAGFDPVDPAWTPERAGTSIGSGLAGLSEIEAAAGSRPSPSFLVRALTNLAAGHVSMAVGAKGPNRAPGTACSAGTHAIAAAADDIRRGRADVVIAGGTEASISPLGVGSFDSMRALSTRAADPAAASRPFDADRDGLVLAEGCGIVILESRDHARERDATPYAAVTGAGRSADAHHVTRPAESGDGLRRCIERALKDAGRDPAAVDHVNAHATSTPIGDAREAEALNTVFAETDVPPTTSVKGHLGHALGAAGAIEAAIVAQTIAEGTIPPTMNYETPDSDCDLPVVAEARAMDVDVAVSTSAGFGGTNGALVFEQP
ncbi:beta-ketoacyl-[acyl-carrier-protein] synthase family protein [Halogeometricum borinquense]|uniref:Beta-ketoacyl-[acyl-carrier-protein] synthase family protein n=1 Tax=Halogeometricum borinquense TaxID=60847 RepID=A0A6C0UMC8_9EURY|nr:beta-ketoacyl-[acyl-carrier-protein] synthase family protein [Halogeometricum borinquense]QIB75039.1 beta-ketoacyl-[acyl-carrier-protein] synthase family protein [Halogeometricum borinquense]QIQ75980.1 beta-ketoacyl-[acyl-carrier-protein] synthase family protein [Halogeometricum borinquense]